MKYQMYEVKLTETGKEKVINNHLNTLTVDDFICTKKSLDEIKDIPENITSKEYFKNEFKNDQMMNDFFTEEQLNQDSFYDDLTLKGNVGDEKILLMQIEDIDNNPLESNPIYHGLSQEEIYEEVEYNCNILKKL